MLKKQIIITNKEDYNEFAKKKISKKKEGKFFSKRVGSVADARSAKNGIKNEENGKQKIPSKAQFSWKRRGEFLEQENDPWVIINGLKQTHL